MFENLKAGCNFRSTVVFGGFLLGFPVERDVWFALGEWEFSGVELLAEFERENWSSVDGRGFGIGSRGGAKMGKVIASFRAMAKINCFAFLGLVQCRVQEK